MCFGARAGAPGLVVALGLRLVYTFALLELKGHGDHAYEHGRRSLQHCCLKSSSHVCTEAGRWQTRQPKPPSHPPALNPENVRGGWVISAARLLLKEAGRLASRIVGSLGWQGADTRRLAGPDAPHLLRDGTRPPAKRHVFTPPLPAVDQPPPLLARGYKSRMVSPHAARCR